MQIHIDLFVVFYIFGMFSWTVISVRSLSNTLKSEDGTLFVVGWYIGISILMFCFSSMWPFISCRDESDPDFDNHHWFIKLFG